MIDLRRNIDRCLDLRSDNMDAIIHTLQTSASLLSQSTVYPLLTHLSAVVILNVLGFYEPLKELIKTAVKGGFIQERNAGFVTFVDGPPDFAEHESFDWGTAGLESLDAWQHKDLKGLSYDWSKRKDSKVGSADPLEAV